MSMNSVHHKKEEWLNSLKDKMAHYQESPPVQGWEALEQALSEGKPSIRRNRWPRMVAVASSVAAVMLLCWILFPISSSLQTGDTPLLTVVTPDTPPSVGTPLPADTVLSSGTPLPADTLLQAGKPGNPDNLSGSISAVKAGGMEPSLGCKDTSLVADRQPLQEQVKIEPARKEEPGTLTWEEYLNREAESADVSTRRRGNWLALSVGNNGVGTFDPRMANASRAMPVAQMAPTQLDPGVKDLMLHKRPENLIISPQAEPIVPEYRHKQPLSFGIKFGKSFSGKFTLETGLVYSLLRSDVDNLQKDKTLRQTLHYLGIPIRFNWNFVHKPKFAVYTGIGAMVEKCVYGELADEKLKIGSVQTSLNFAVGAQYKFSPMLGIYFEPGLSYYLGMKDDGSLGTIGNGILIKSIHSENPLGFTLQAGFRFSF